jgi:hypothetical protein
MASAVIGFGGFRWALSRCLQAMNEAGGVNFWDSFDLLTGALASGFYTNSNIVMSLSPISANSLIVSFHSFDVNTRRGICE